MKWLQDVTKAVLEVKDAPIHWVTPAGLPVQQCYRKQANEEIEIRSEGRRFRTLMWKESSVGVHKRRMKSGVAPNFVHSMDAAHLMMTVAYAGGTCGLQSFAMVHDSFGVHATDAERFAVVLREMFLEMYNKHDVLSDFLYGLTAEVSIPSEGWPRKAANGFLDLDQVIESNYFFA